MKKKHSIVISVRSLVEFILRSGDITSLGFHSSRAVEGTKAHQKIQKKAPKNYQAEVVIQFTQDYGNFELVLNGRIDGVIHETVKVIDEIKSTVKDVAFIKENDHPVHWAQAEIYAYMYACAHNLEMIDVQLTYVQVHGEGIKQFKRRYTSKEIEERALEIIHRYGQWAELFYQWEIKKYQSIKALKFPFQTFRKGQKSY